MGVVVGEYDLTWVGEGVVNHLDQVGVLEVWQGGDGVVVVVDLALVRLFHGV